MRPRGGIENYVLIMCVYVRRKGQGGEGGKTRAARIGARCDCALSSTLRVFGGSSPLPFKMNRLGSGVITEP